MINKKIKFIEIVLIITFLIGIIIGMHFNSFGFIISIISVSLLIIENYKKDLIIVFKNIFDHNFRGD